jgi:hypothetical protein
MTVYCQVLKVRQQHWGGPNLRRMPQAHTRMVVTSLYSLDMKVAPLRTRLARKACLATKPLKRSIGYAHSAYLVLTFIFLDLQLLHPFLDF